MQQTKRFKRLTALALMAFRCEFIDGATLTKKGKGFLTASQWRWYNNLKGTIFPQWRKDMVAFLESIDRMNKVADLYPSGSNGA